MIWILSARWGWCGPYNPEHVRAHLRLLAAVAVAGPCADKVETLRTWAEDLEPAICLIERDPPVGMVVMPDYRFTVRDDEGCAVTLYGWDERPGRTSRDPTGEHLAALCAMWARGTAYDA